MKPGATDRQKQRRLQRGYRGHGERARVQKGADSCNCAFLRFCHENPAVAASDSPFEAS